MATKFITKEDLELFETELVDKIEKLLLKARKTAPTRTNVKKTQTPPPVTIDSPWVKSAQVKKLLGISNSTLQRLRIEGVLPYSRIGGLILYTKADIETIINKNKRNTKRL